MSSFDSELGARQESEANLMVWGVAAERPEVIERIASVRSTEGDQLFASFDLHYLCTFLPNYIKIFGTLYEQDLPSAQIEPRVYRLPDLILTPPEHRIGLTCWNGGKWRRLGARSHIAE